MVHRLTRPLLRARQQKPITHVNLHVARPVAGRTRLRFRYRLTRKALLSARARPSARRSSARDRRQSAPKPAHHMLSVPEFATTTLY